MTEIPKRSSLVAQAADILRDGIERGDWRERLPGEHTLRVHLKIGRRTLREALDMLQREGRIVVSQGKHRRIVSRSPRAAPFKQTKAVGVLVGLPQFALSSFQLYLISELQEYLHDAGVQVEIHSNPKFMGSNPSKALRNLMTRSSANCMILIAGTEELRRWFTQRQIPILSISGLLVDRSILPCVDVDWRMILCHAVGTFLARGHRRIALLPSSWNAAETAFMDREFHAAFPASRLHSDVQPIVIHHEGKLDFLPTVLDAAWAAPHPPTALLVQTPRHVLTTMSHLAGIGVLAPRDVSLISMHHLPFLNDLCPKVAHYTFPWKTFAKRVCGLTRRMVTQGHLPEREFLITPEFQDGGTLAPPPV